MKKLIQFGAFCLALSFASCKTYCPAYSSVQPTVTAEQETVTATTTTSAVAEDEVNS